MCLVLAAAGPSAVPVFLPGEHFTLAWTHSIEKVRWEEDYAVRAGPPLRLQALRARIRGSAAGMEPPADAVLQDGWYNYQPATRSPEGLRLTRSEFTADYDWCDAQHRCTPLAHWLPSDGNITLLVPCKQP